jgi:hypothetical protein
MAGRTRGVRRAFDLPDVYRALAIAWHSGGRQGAGSIPKTCRSSGVALLDPHACSNADLSGRVRRCLEEVRAGEALELSGLGEVRLQCQEPFVA